MHANLISNQTAALFEIHFLHESSESNDTKFAHSKDGINLFSFMVTGTLMSRRTKLA